MRMHRMQLLQMGHRTRELRSKALLGCSRLQELPSCLTLYSRLSLLNTSHRLKEMPTLQPVVLLQVQKIRDA